MSVYLKGTALVAGNEIAGYGPVPRPGRSDLPTRYVIAAASVLLDVPGNAVDETGVFLGSANGCLDVDLRFAGTLDSRPSPRFFARTLPSTPAAEVAVRFGLRGPNTCLVQSENAGWLAVLAAVQEIEVGSCSEAVAGEYDAVDPELDDRGMPYAALVHLGDSPGEAGESCRVILESGEMSLMSDDRFPSGFRDLCVRLRTGKLPVDFRWRPVAGGPSLRLVSGAETRNG